MEEKIWEIIAASIHGEELSFKEMEILHDWLEESEQNRDTYMELTAFYNESKGTLSKDIDVCQAWNVNRAKRNTRRKIRYHRYFMYAGYAAVLILLIGVSVLLLTDKREGQPVKMELAASQIVPGSPKAMLTLASGEQLDLQKEGCFVSKDSSEIRNKGNVLEYAAGINKSKNNLEYNTLTIPRGGEYRLRLEDGSRVWLNAETELRFPIAFGNDERRIFLKGEAYFEVAKDSRRPFIVSVNGVDVTALGTEFNIAAVQGEDEVFTTLVNGSVRVMNAKGVDCLLNPAEQAICKKDEAEIGVQKVNTALYTSWKDGYYAFDRQPLDEIMRTLSRWYDIEVVFADAEVEKLRFSGRLKRYEDITNLLTMIKLTNDVNFKIEEQTIIVSMNKNRK